VPDEAPQLFQVIGAALRDVAQARFMSDLYSRQISFTYEKDPLLRRFPVPRVEVDEVELTLQFAVAEVSVDPHRHTSLNGGIGSLFGEYTIAIIRNDFNLLREVIGKLSATELNDDQKALLAQFGKEFLSDQKLQRLSGRLLQYLNESAEDILDGASGLKVDAVVKSLEEDPNLSVLKQPEVVKLMNAIPQQPAGPPAEPPPLWADAIRRSKEKIQNEVQDLAKAVGALYGKYPDFKLVVDVGARTLATPAVPLSSIRIKSSVKNYKWAMVDVDNEDLRHIRTLSPE
jgi:hypothetical protein